MAMLKCKMCGGNLEVNANLTVGTCQYCGSTMTLPRDADEKKANLFNRANHYRRNSDFDKAMATYENILNEDNNDAEAHWGVVLCKYGIEYVEDPSTHVRIPTCHRAQYDSILIDADYAQALANADEFAKVLYIEEAKAIDQIQKQILDISSKEEPFEVFICYKESSETGSRTKDSVLAQDIYHQLSEVGLKVFFSRITLEDKLGSAYEPYIFAALNSSKVMVVVGTKPEHFNAAWTKNEWSRFLALIKKGDKKVLIPAYRDMDPYDLPEEFSHLQAQDMGKIGFIQDLTRGIQKVVSGNEQKPAANAAAASQTNSNTNSLLDRAFLSLEDADFSKADQLLEQVLNNESRNARAYLGKLMVELHIEEENQIPTAALPLHDSGNYQKAIRFADEIFANKLRGYNQVIIDRIENQNKETIYLQALGALRSNGLSNALDLFKRIPGYKEADWQVTECIRLMDEARAAEAKEREKTRLKQEQERLRQDQEMRNFGKLLYRSR